MGSGSTQQLGWVERYSPRLFLVGGALVVGHAAVNGLEAFTEIGPPPDVFGPAGYLLGVLGLLGLYPALADRSPRAARLAAALAVVVLLGWIGILAQTVGVAVGVVGPDAGVLPGVFLFAHLAGLVLSYLLFGALTLVTGGHSRTVGGLLLLVPLFVVGLVAGAHLFGNSAAGSFLLGTLLALTHLSVGIALGAGGSPRGMEAATGEVATR